MTPRRIAPEHAPAAPAPGNVVSAAHGPGADEGMIASWRYRRGLPLLARGPVGGRIYARLVARAGGAHAVERRRAAVARLVRWYGVDARRAAAIHRACLLSEAQEEADSLRFMHDPGAFERWLPRDVPALPAGPVVLAGLHLGSPVLGFLALRRRGVRDVHALVRALDDGNPMQDEKRRWGEEKLAWVRSVGRGGIFGTEPAAIAAARDHLCAGNAIFAALDVPGDVVGRSAVVEMHGERLLFASGVLQLARLTRSTVVPMVALGSPRGLRLRFGAPIAPGGDPAAATFAALGDFVDRFPDEWWMWPYLRAASGDRESAAGD